MCSHCCSPAHGHHRWSVAKLCGIGIVVLLLYFSLFLCFLVLVFPSDPWWNSAFESQLRMHIAVEGKKFMIFFHSYCICGFVIHLHCCECDLLDFESVAFGLLAFSCQSEIPLVYSFGLFCHRSCSKLKTIPSGFHFFFLLILLGFCSSYFKCVIYSFSC